MEVQHDRQQRRFYVAPDDGEAEAELTYTQRDGVLDLGHTYVPPAHRGRGIADRMARRAFEYAREEGYAVVPSCPYVRDTFLERHPEFRDIVK